MSAVWPLEIAIVNHNTAAHLYALVRSIQTILPHDALEAVHVWDNASSDQSVAMLERFAASAPWLRVHASAANVYHGPALDALLTSCCRRPWVLALDSDTEVRRPFGEALDALHLGDEVFVGQIHPQMPHLYAYLCHLLINRSAYGALPGFIHDGAPGRAFFLEVERLRRPYRRFRWSDYVDHLGQGTLRTVHERHDRANAFFDFAARESLAAPKSPARLARERQMEDALCQFLHPLQKGDGSPSGCTQFLPRDPSRPGGVRAAPAVLAGPTRPVVHRAPLRLTRLRNMLATAASPGAALAVRRARRFGLVQRLPEIRRLYAMVRRLCPASVVEIGTAHGGTFYLWARASAPGARLISVDLPPWEIDDPWEARKRQALTAFARRRQRVELIRGDSHEPATIAAVESRLAAQPIDFLFIDGDHSYEGVKQDFSMYTRYVRPGGLVALHDIQSHSRGWGGEVPRFWREIKGRFDSLEIVDDRDQDGFGIGVLRMA